MELKMAGISSKVNNVQLTPVLTETPVKPLHVMFVYPNTLLTNRIPLALSVMSACLRQVGHTTSLFDTTFMRIEAGQSDEEARYATLQVREADLTEYGVDWDQVENVERMFRERVVSENPDLIAVTVVENTYGIALRLLNAVADLGVSTLLGGVRVTTEPESIIAKDCVNMICMGEGEAAIVELCNALAAGEDVTQIQNIWVKENGRIYRNPMRPLTDMATLPIQDWSIFEDRHLYRPLGGIVYRMGNFEISRGCPFTCQYCIEPGYAEIYRGLQPRSNLRHKPLELAIDEIASFKESHGIELVYFHDETFLAMPKKRFEKFCELYTSRIGLPYAIQTTASTISEETAQMLEDSGCINIAIGLETGNQEFRRRVLKKNVTDNHIYNAFRILKRYPRIRATANNIIGLPYETRELIMETVELNKRTDPDATNVNLFYPYRGSPLREVCIKEGFIVGDEEPIGYRTGSILKMSQISQSSLIALQKTFNLYVRLPRFLWPLIGKLERAIEHEHPFADVFFKLMVSLYRVWVRDRYG